MNFFLCKKKKADLAGMTVVNFQDLEIKDLYQDSQPQTAGTWTLASSGICLEESHRMHSWKENRFGRAGS